MNESTPRLIEPSAAAQPPMSLAQAKANLLAQGEQTSREVEALIEKTRLDVQQTVVNLKRAVPWAAAAALGAGLFMGRSRRRRRPSGADAGPVGGASGAAADRVKWAVTTLGPIAMNWILRASKSGADRRRDGA